MKIPSLLNADSRPVCTRRASCTPLISKMLTKNNSPSLTSLMILSLSYNFLACKFGELESEPNSAALRLIETVEQRHEYLSSVHDLKLPPSRCLILPMCKVNIIYIVWVRKLKNKGEVIDSFARTTNEPQSTIGTPGQEVVLL